MIGTTLQNRYRIESELGRGGMGEVYRAVDMQTGEAVAVKALNADVLARDPDLLARFIREGEALRALNHPNIVHMVAAVEERGKHYLVMEFVEGGSLKDVLSLQKNIPSQRALEISLDLADALTRAHRLGIIHRDLKPANVLIAKDGTPRLADFGIAHMESDQHLTQTGALIGTMDYLSPEICQGERPDERSDIWAFGVMLFEMLSGRLPFEGGGIKARLTAILTQPVPDLTQLAPATSLSVVHLINRMLEKDRQWRIPSVRLVGAELEAILKGRESVTPMQAASISSVPVSRNNLPTNLSKFVGREKEIAEVTRTLRDYRLVTLTGSGGVGKTRLSLQVATELLGQFPNGVWFVELAPVTDPELIPQTILSAADIQPQQGRSALDSLKDFLREKTSLVVLDNCEHLIEACARLADMLLNAAPNLKIIASSREALGVPCERAWYVPSLSIPDVKHLPSIDNLSHYEAVRLFVDRALLVQPHFALTDDNAPAVAQICSRLDGIPLAIELAAARVKVLKPEQIAEKLNDRFRLLTGGSRTTLPRQQTLRALVDWSYDLLAEKEKLLLRRLSVFKGGWTLETAEQACSDGQIHADDVLDLLIHLVDKSLVAAEEHPERLRYRMLETVRQYAHQKLAEAGEAENANDQYLRTFTELAEKAEPEIRGFNLIAWLDILDDEIDNLRVALEWSQKRDNQSFLRLASALWRFWDIRGHTADFEWLPKALGDTVDFQTTLRARALGRAAYVASNHGDSERGKFWAKEALTLSRILDDKTSLVLALTLQSIFESDHPQGLILLGEALTLAQEIGDQWLIAAVQAFRAGLLLDQNDVTSARSILEQGVKAAHSCGDKRLISWGVRHLGVIALAQGDATEAEKWYRVALEEAQAMKDNSNIYLHHSSIVVAKIFLEDYASAKEMMPDALNLAQENKAFVGQAFLNAAWIDLAQGNISRAVEQMKEGLIFAKQTANALIIANLNFWLGESSRRKGDFAQAIIGYFEAMSIYQKDNLAMGFYNCLEGLGMLAIDQGQVDKGIRLLGVREILRNSVFIIDFPFMVRERESHIAVARSQLSEDEFNAAWAEGRAMTVEQAIAYAFEKTQ